jgi:hypothetical protein
VPQRELENLVRSGLLIEEPPGREEFEGLLRSAEARLADAVNPANSVDSRFDLAYNAAHALALAALRWHGYRPDRKRYIVFQALEHTLNVENPTWRLLGKVHDHRNQTEYGGLAPIDTHLLEGLLAAGQDLLKRVRALPLPPDPGR